MRFSQVLRDERLGEVPAKRRLPRSAEHPLGGRVEPDDRALLVDQNGPVQGRIQESRKSVVGKVRGGGPTVSVHTGSGDVQVD